MGYLNYGTSGHKAFFCVSSTVKCNAWSVILKLNFYIRTLARSKLDFCWARVVLQWRWPRNFVIKAYQKTPQGTLCLSKVGPDSTGFWRNICQNRPRTGCPLPGLQTIHQRIWNTPHNKMDQFWAWLWPVVQCWHTPVPLLLVRISKTI